MSAEARMLSALDDVTHAALLHASDKFITDPADPGWGAEVHDEMLIDAVTRAAADIEQWKIAKKNLEGG